MQWQNRLTKLSTTKRSHRNLSLSSRPPNSCPVQKISMGKSSRWLFKTENPAKSSCPVSTSVPIYLLHKIPIFSVTLNVPPFFVYCHYKYVQFNESVCVFEQRRIRKKRWGGGQNDAMRTISLGKRPRRSLSACDAIKYCWIGYETIASCYSLLSHRVRSFIAISNCKTQQMRQKCSATRTISAELFRRHKQLSSLCAYKTLK